MEIRIVAGLDGLAVALVKREHAIFIGQVWALVATVPGIHLRRLHQTPLLALSGFFGHLCRHRRVELAVDELHRAVNLHRSALLQPPQLVRVGHQRPAHHAVCCFVRVGGQGGVLIQGITPDILLACVTSSGSVAFWFSAIHSIILNCWFSSLKSKSIAMIVSADAPKIFNPCIKCFSALVSFSIVHLLHDCVNQFSIFFGYRNPFDYRIVGLRPIRIQIEKFVSISIPLKRNLIMKLGEALKAIVLHRFQLNTTSTPCFYRISCFDLYINCTTVLYRGQIPDFLHALLRLLHCGLIRRRQLPLGVLRRPVFLAAENAPQPADQLADCVAHLLQQRAVVPVPLDELVQHLAALQHPPCIVRRRLVQRLLVGKFHAFFRIILLHFPRTGLPIAALRDCVAELPVLLRRKRLQSMRPLVAQQEAQRIWVIFFDQHLCAAELRVCLSAFDLIREPHAHAQQLCRPAEPLRLRLGEMCFLGSDRSGLRSRHDVLHPCVVNKTGVAPVLACIKVCVSRRDRRLVCGGLFLCERSRSVDPARVVGRLLLHRRQRVAILHPHAVPQVVLLRVLSRAPAAARLAPRTAFLKK